MMDLEERAVLAQAQADCGCAIPAPFDEVAEHAIHLAYAKAIKDAAEVARRMYVQDAFRFEFGNDVATAIEALGEKKDG